MKDIQAAIAAARAIDTLNDVMIAFDERHGQYVSVVNQCRKEVAELASHVRRNVGPVVAHIIKTSDGKGSEVAGWFLLRNTITGSYYGSKHDFSCKQCYATKIDYARCLFVAAQFENCEIVPAL